MKARSKAYLLLLGAIIIWSVAAPIIKLTLNGIDPFVFLTYRLLISALISIPFFVFDKPKLPRSLNTWLLLIVHCLLSVTFGLGLLFYGLTTTTVLDLTLITIAGPLILSLAGVFFFKEHISLQEKKGTFIAVAGTIIAVLAPLILNHSGIPHLSGNILIFASMLTDIAATLLLKKIMREKVSPVFIANFAFIVGLVTIGPYTIHKVGLPVIVSSIQNLSLPYHLGVWYMAVLSGTVAYIMRNYAQKTIEVSEASLFGYLGPIISTPLAIIWLGEKITLSFILGALVVITGVYIAEKKKH